MVIQKYTPAQMEVVTKIVVAGAARGWDDLHIAAFLGNCEGETPFDPKARGDKDKAFSLLQWHWDPRGALILQHTDVDVRYCDADGAIKAALWEMYDPKSTYRRVGPLFDAAKSIPDCIIALVRKLEQSASPTSDIFKRTTHALYWATRVENGKLK